MKIDLVVPAYIEVCILCLSCYQAPSWELAGLLGTRDWTVWEGHTFQLQTDQTADILRSYQQCAGCSCSWQWEQLPKWKSWQDSQTLVIT